MYHDLWETCVSPASSFIKGYQNFLDRRSSTRHKARGDSENRRDLTQPFSSATHLFSRILVLTKQILHHGLQLTSTDVWAKSCSRCFGPATNEIKVSNQEPDVIVCMDGNFQHRHNILASKDNPDESQYPSIFVRPSEIAKHKTPLDPPPPDKDEVADDPCGDAHKAANDTQNASTWDQCDDTGLFAMACRHDVPLLMANIYQSGEKYHYPLSLLQSLLDDFPDLQLGVLYDIGCHLDKHITKHKKLPEYQCRIMLGTSVFHAYVHSWSCQLSYNPRFLEFWGLSDGEGLERTWLDLAALVARSRTSTRLHRLQLIGGRCDYLIIRNKKHTMDWLQRRLKSTNTTIAAAQETLDMWLQKPNPHQPGELYTRAFFRAQWDSERKHNLTTSKDVKIRQKLELGKLLCLEDQMYQVWDRDEVHVLGAFDRLARFQDLEAQIAAQRNKVGITDALTNLNQAGQDSFLKVWFAKTEVRTRFLALRAEQRPLDPENRVGGTSRLGKYKSPSDLLSMDFLLPS